AIITTVSPKTTETTTQTIISSTTMTETLTRTSTIATTQTLLISDVITSAETYNYTHTITIARGAIIMKTTTVQGIQGINLPNLSVDNVSSNINSNVSSIVTVTAGLSVVAIVIGKSLLARGRRSRGK